MREETGDGVMRQGNEGIGEYVACSRRQGNR